MARQATIGTLHTSSVLEKIAAERASHDIVERLLDELVAELFDDFFLLLTHRTFTAETKIKWATFSVLFSEFEGETYLSNRLEGKPVVDHDRSSLWLGAGYGTLTAWWRIEMKVRPALWRSVATTHPVC